MGVSRETIRKAARDGRLSRCNGVTERPEFTVEEVDRFIEAMDRERELARAKPLPRVQRSMDLAKVDAVTSMVGQAQDHTEHAWEAARKILDTARRDYESMLDGKDREIERLTDRIEKLEDKQDDYRAALDLLNKHRYDETIAKAQADVVRLRGAALLKVGKVAAPAVLARLFGGEQLTQGALQAFIEDMGNDQRTKVFAALAPLLDETQFGVLQTLFSAWDARQSDTERPPPMNGTGTDG